MNNIWIQTHILLFALQVVALSLGASAGIVTVPFVVLHFVTAFGFEFLGERRDVDSHNS